MKTSAWQCLLLTCLLASPGISQNCGIQPVAQFDYPEEPWYLYLAQDQDVLATASWLDLSGITIYRRQAGSWVHEQTLPHSDRVYGLAISGDVLAVLLFEPGGIAAHIYRHFAGVWSFEQRIFREDLLEGLDVDGDRLVLGWETPEDLHGRVLVYQFDGSQWGLEASLYRSPSSHWDQLGRSLDIEGDRILAGAPRHRLPSEVAIGAAVVFRHNGTSWESEARLAPNRWGQVGSEVALDTDSQGRPVAVTKESRYGPHPQFQGVSIWRLSGGEWQEEATIATPTYRRGTSGVATWALREDSLFVGRPDASYPGANYGGAIDWYRYTGDWNIVARLVPSVPRVDGLLGQSGLGVTMVANGDRVTAADGIPGESTIHHFDAPEFAMTAAPDLLSSGDTLDLTIGGGISGNPFIVFVVSVNGNPFSAPILPGILGAGGGGSVSAVVPPNPLLPGIDLELQAWTVSNCGVISTLPAKVSFQ